MAEQLVFYLSKRFDKEIKLEPVNLKAGERVARILDGTIDIEMGASTKNYKREASVDFSFVYFSSETTFLIKKDSGIDTIQDLNLKTIAVGKGTTNEQILGQLVKSRRLTPKNVLSFELLAK